MTEQLVLTNPKRWIYPLIIVVGILGILGVIGFVGMTVFSRVSVKYTRIHQQNVIHELKQWEKEYSIISNRQDALRSVEMIQYVKHYYVAGPGYHSDPRTEKNLENQRKSTLDSIRNSLRQYTKQDGGDDLNRWKEIIQKMPGP